MEHLPYTASVGVGLITGSVSFSMGWGLIESAVLTVAAILLLTAYLNVAAPSS